MHGGRSKVIPASHFIKHQVIRVTAEHAARRRTKRRIGDRTHNLGFGSAYHTVGVREPDHPSKSPKKFQCRRAVMQTAPCMEIGELLELDRFE